MEQLRTRPTPESPDRNRLFSRENALVSGAILATAGIIAGTTFLHLREDGRREQAEIDTLEQTMEDGLVLVPRHNGNVYLDHGFSGGNRSVHIKLGTGDCSAWATVINVEDDPEDTQRYILEVGDLQYDFTDNESMISVLGDDPCQMPFINSERLTQED
jgi:hypothetical protein